jgi:hypothetical protein
VLEANRLATDANKENALLKEEVSKLKQHMKDEQDAGRAAAVAVDKRKVSSVNPSRIYWVKFTTHSFLLGISLLATDLSFFQRPPI